MRAYVMVAIFWSAGSLAASPDVWESWKLKGTAKTIARVIGSGKKLSNDERQILLNLRLFDAPLLPCEVLSVKALNHRQEQTVPEGRIVRALLKAPWGLKRAAQKVFYNRLPLSLGDFHDFRDEPIEAKSVELSFLDRGFWSRTPFPARMDRIELYQYFVGAMQVLKRRGARDQGVEHVFLESLTIDSQESFLSLSAILRFSEGTDLRLDLNNVKVSSSLGLSAAAAEILAAEVFRVRSFALPAAEAAPAPDPIAPDPEPVELSPQDDADGGDDVVPPWDGELRLLPAPVSKDD